MFYKGYNTTGKKADWLNLVDKVQKEIKRDFDKIAKKQNFAANDRIIKNLAYLADYREIINLLNANNAETLDEI